MDFRVGSAPARTSYLGSGSALIADPTAESLSGFLNRKCVQEAGGKKSKDRSWQTFWCQLKGLALEFHRVDGVKCEGTRPPPRDIYPLPHLVSSTLNQPKPSHNSILHDSLQWLKEAQHKAGFVSLEGAEVQLDYTSQMDKDLQKRRACLFQLTLPNKVVYLLQAPGVNQRTQWVQHVRRASRGFHGDDIDSRTHYDTKIKAARCSVRHRSRQNVLSLKDPHSTTSPEEDAELAATFREDPRMQLLRKRLTAKRELLSQLNRMCNSFLGDSSHLYSEDVRAHQAIPHLAAEPAVSRRLSLPSPRVISLLPPSQLDPRRASTGGFSVPLSRNDHTVSPSTDVRTELLQDYRLVPGASWSMVQQGEKVRVTGKLANGWFRCLVERDTLASIAGDASQSISSHLSEASGDSGFPPSERQSLISDALPASPTHRKEGRYREEEEEEEEMFVADVLPDEPESLPASSRGLAGRHGMRVGRSYSYIRATEGNYESSLLPRQQQQLPEAPKQEGEVEGKRPRMLSMDGYLTDLLESELQTGRYTFPLVGVLPPSVLKHVPQMDDLPVLPPLPSPSHSPTHHSPPSPFHSPTHHPPPSSSQSLTQQLPSSPSHSPTHHEEPSQYSTHQQNGHLVSLHAALSPSHSLPARKQKSNSAPVTPNVTPTHTPSPSPIPPAPHTTPTSNGGPPDEQISHSLPPSNLISSQKHPNSPTRRPRATRRRSHEPIATIMDSGHSFIKKLFPRRKTSKQNSISEVPQAPTIEEESPSSPTPVLPPPMLQNLRDNEFEESPRMRVSSMSGRPIRNTGIALVIGEEESSSGSDSESSHEDSAEAAELSHSLPSSSPLATALLHPEISSAGETKVGSLRRTASAHDSLNVKIEPAPITTETRAKSGSTHSLRNVSLTLPFHSLWKGHAAPDEPPKRKSSRKKKRGSWSEAMEGESPKLSGIFRQPPTGQKRFVYLDPRQPKHGFRLESYGRPRERGRIIQTFVQSVAPGSPAFMNGLFPGDTILEVNGVSVRREPVTTIVNLIMNSQRNSPNKIQLVVMFVDGVTRLEKMKRADQLKYQMKIKQAQLREMKAEEHRHLSHLTHLPKARSIILAADLRPWSRTIPPADPVPHPYPYDSVLNDLIALHIGSPSQLAADVLVLPLSSTLQLDSGNVLTQLLWEGGSELIDELCLASYCPLGENIETEGHQLPCTFVYHCVFGNLEESLQSCICHALEDGSMEKHSSIVFWLDGFTAINVIEAVRLWLQEGGNSARFRKVVFSARANPPFAELLLERYFPLHPFHPRGSVSSTGEGGQDEVARKEDAEESVASTPQGRDKDVEASTSPDVTPADGSSPTRTPTQLSATPGTPPPSTPSQSTPPTTPGTPPPSTPSQSTSPTTPGSPPPSTLTPGTPPTTPHTTPLTRVQRRELHPPHGGGPEEGGGGDQGKPADEVTTEQEQVWSGASTSHGSGAGLLSASPRVLNPLRLESDV